MTTPDEDIFGQIDALLGKRSPAVLTEKNLQGDDFPMLTEIIQSDVSASLQNMAENQIITSEYDARQVERRVCERRHGSSSESSKMLSSAINTPDLEALEIRLMDLIRSQHATLEKSLSSIIREEIKRFKMD